MSTCSLFFVLCMYIHVGNWLPYESLLRKYVYIYIGFQILWDFFSEAWSPNFLQILPASLNLWKILEYSGAKVKVLVFIFFSSYFSMGKSQRQRYFSASHISVWYIGMEQGLFLWRLWFPFPISPAFVCRRYQGKEQAWVEERTKKKKDVKTQKGKWRKMKTGRDSQLDGKLELGGTSANWFPDFTMKESEVQSLQVTNILKLKYSVSDQDETGSHFLSSYF